MTLEEALLKIEWLTKENEVLLKENNTLKTIISKLEGQIQKLEERIHKNSSNSSKPPSSDGPWKTLDKDAARTKRNRMKRLRKKRGGITRSLVPVEQVDHVIPVFPETCSCCGKALSCEPCREAHRHQQVEVPEPKVTITEYQMHAVKCAECGEITRASLPEGVTPSAFGTRLTSTIALLSGGFRLSKRHIQWLLQLVWGIDISISAISHAEERVSDGLETPYEEACEHIRGADVVFGDETPWKQQHQLHWLWTVGTEDVAIFRINKKRDQVCAESLLGKKFPGIFVSDRYGVYSFIPMQRRQVCWAHLIRDFEEIAENKDLMAQYVGTSVIEGISDVIECWHRYRDGACEHAVFREEVLGLCELIETTIDIGMTSESSWTRAKCKALLAYRKAFWTFVHHPDVTPTNNISEQRLRHGVIFRKVNLGTQSVRGSRFIERIHSAIHSLKAQGRQILPYLCRVLESALSNTPPPSFLPASV